MGIVYLELAAIISIMVSIYLLDRITDGKQTTKQYFAIPGTVALIFVIILVVLYG